MKKTVLRKARVLFLFLVLSAVMLPVQAHAAWKNYMWDGDTPVKTGGRWFRAEGRQFGGKWGNQIQMSRKSKKTGFVTLVEGKGIDSGFATDGKTIYYTQNNVLKSYVISSKKKTALKKLPLPTRESYYTFNGYFNGKIWYVCREGKYIGKRMVSWDVQKKTLKTEKKNFIIWNAAAASRYSVMTTGTKEMNAETGAGYKLKVLDKKTGKYTTIADGVTPMTYASGGSYKTLEDWFIYGEFDEETGCWKIKQYTFKTGKTKTLKTLKKGTVFDGLMYTGDGVVLMSDGEFRDENRIRAK